MDAKVAAVWEFLQADAHTEYWSPFTPENTADVECAYQAYADASFSDRTLRTVKIQNMWGDFTIDLLRFTQEAWATRVMKAIRRRVGSDATPSPAMQRAGLITAPAWDGEGPCPFTLVQASGRTNVDCDITRCFVGETGLSTLAQLEDVGVVGALHAAAAGWFKSAAGPRWRSPTAKVSSQLRRLKRSATTARFRIVDPDENARVQKVRACAMSITAPLCAPKRGGQRRGGTGIVNLGSTCFMASCIHALAACDSVRAAFFAFDERGARSARAARVMELCDALATSTSEILSARALESKSPAAPARKQARRSAAVGSDGVDALDRCALNLNAARTRAVGWDRDIRIVESLRRVFFLLEHSAQAAIDADAPLGSRVAPRNSVVFRAKCDGDGSGDGAAGGDVDGAAGGGGGGGGGAAFAAAALRTPFVRMTGTYVVEGYDREGIAVYRRVSESTETDEERALLAHNDEASGDRARAEIARMREALIAPPHPNDQMLFTVKLRWKGDEEETRSWFCSTREVHEMFMTHGNNAEVFNHLIRMEEASNWKHYTAYARANALTGTAHPWDFDLKWKRTDNAGHLFPLEALRSSQGLLALVEASSLGMLRLGLPDSPSLFLEHLLKSCFGGEDSSEDVPASGGASAASASDDVAAAEAEASPLLGQLRAALPPARPEGLPNAMCYYTVPVVAEGSGSSSVSALDHARLSSFVSRVASSSEAAASSASSPSTHNLYDHLRANPIAAADLSDVLIFMPFRYQGDRDGSWSAPFSFDDTITLHEPYVEVPPEEKRASGEMLATESCPAAHHARIRSIEDAVIRISGERAALESSSSTSSSSAALPRLLLVEVADTGGGAVASNGDSERAAALGKEHQAALRQLHGMMPTHPMCTALRLDAAASRLGAIERELSSLTRSKVGMRDCALAMRRSLAACAEAHSAAAPRFVTSASTSMETLISEVEAHAATLVRQRDGARGELAGLVHDAAAASCVSSTTRDFALKAVTCFNDAKGPHYVTYVRESAAAAGGGAAAAAAGVDSTWTLYDDERVVEGVLLADAQRAWFGGDMEAKGASGATGLGGSEKTGHSHAALIFYERVALPSHTLQQHALSVEEQELVEKHDIMWFGVCGTVDGTLARIDADAAGPVDELELTTYVATALRSLLLLVFIYTPSSSLASMLCSSIITDSVSSSCKVRKTTFHMIVMMLSQSSKRRSRKCE